MPDQNAVIPMAHCSDAVGEGLETEVSEHTQKVMHKRRISIMWFYCQIL